MSLITFCLSTSPNPLRTPITSGANFPRVRVLSLSHLCERGSLSIDLEGYLCTTSDFWILCLTWCKQFHIFFKYCKTDSNFGFSSFASERVSCRTTTQPVFSIFLLVHRLRSLCCDSVLSIQCICFQVYHWIVVFLVRILFVFSSVLETIVYLAKLIVLLF